MPSLLQRYATPLTAGLFLVSLISGLALFFHVGQATFREMHEWLSLLLALPFVLHLWKNWKPMLGYLRKPALALSLVITLVLAAPFALQAASGSADGPPQFALSHTLMGANAADLAPLLKTSPDALLGHLKAAGFTAAADGHPLTEIASKSGKSEFELAATLNTLPK